MSNFNSSRSYGQTARRLRAFTLVELLVVIGIIALLISVLMPALARARGAAKAIACGSNLRQIGQAIYMYANDNKGVLPVGRYALDSGGNMIWDTQLSRYLGRPCTNLYVNSDPPPVLKCPNDIVPRPINPTAIRSYAMVEAGGPWGAPSGSQRVAYGVASESPNSPNSGYFNKQFRTFKFTDIRQSSKVLMVAESFGTITNPNTAGHAQNALIQNPNGQLTGYAGLAHYDKWNYLFVDGHVELLYPLDTVNGDKTKLTAAPPGGMWVRDQ